MGIKTVLRDDSRLKKSKKQKLRIATSQFNPTLADFEKNSKKIISEIVRAHQKQCDIVVFPEAALFGYHPFDLLERIDSVKSQVKFISEIEKVIPKGIVAIFGCFTINKNKKGRPFFNSAAVVERGKKTRFINKTLLPTGDVFDEARFIEPGDLQSNVIQVKGNKILVTICEDIWAWPKSGKSIYSFNPLEKIKKTKIDLVLNLSASPFYLEKFKERYFVVKETARFFKAPVIYTNLVGSQDEIIFDGRSFAVDERGKLFSQSAHFEEDLNILDFNKMESGVRPDLRSHDEELRQALVLGIRDYCKKTGLETVHLGLSGGIDSAVVAALAVDALGASKVKAFALPSEFNAEESLTLAKQLAINLGIEFKVLSIQPAFDLIKNQLNRDLNVQGFSLLHENLQARIRGILLMAFSNLKGSMLLSTSNKSEIATGYSTLYGDMCGGLAPIGDLLKRQVYSLARHYNLETEIIPSRIIERAPSAELRPNQKDQDSLPEYDLLDQLVEDFVVDGKPIKTEKARWLFSKISNNEFKRWQAPPILKVSKHSFGRGRRWPVAHKLKL